jgi:hypothetical protein
MDADSRRFEQEETGDNGEKPNLSSMLAQSSPVHFPSADFVS